MPNEWEFVADCSSQINHILQRRPDLTFSKTSVEGQRNRRDLTLETPTGERITGEVHLLDHTLGGTPYLDSLVRDAQSKANDAGVGRGSAVVLAAGAQTPILTHVTSSWYKPNTLTPSLKYLCRLCCAPQTMP